MSDEKWLAIVLLTFNRYDYAERTLRSVLDLISYSGSLAVHIASDGDDDEYVEDLRQIAGGYAKVKKATKSNSERGGYGRNWNLATQVVHGFADYVLPLEDDWELREPLNVDRLLPALDSPQIDCIRLGYVGFTDTLQGVLRRFGDDLYLKFAPYSMEKHVFAGHPRIETVQWEKLVGPWPEGLTPGETELAVCAKPWARENVAWPLDLAFPTRGLFQHIGTRRSSE